MDTINEDDLILVREVLAREIETINTYQTQLARARDESVRAFLAHITDEEKEHVAEAVELIRSMDPVQAGLLDSGHVTRNSAAPISTASSGTGAPPNPTGFTVGSLRR
ncbi:MAG TPA: hypothetical protein VFV34_05725 [Blastocatellia bacterium]|nr:hypothetical protein [Blastocatellia bacterium]